MDTLREITQRYYAILEMGEIPEEERECFEATLEDIKDDLRIKAENYAVIIQAWDSKVAMYKAEIDRLNAKKKALENSKDRLKKNLEEAMRFTGETKFSTDLYSFNIQKNPASVVLAPDLDVNSIPAEYLKFSDPTVDKTAVKEALKNGTDLGWARLEQTESLRIK